jgi:hypothetical protein
LFILLIYICLIYYIFSNCITNSNKIIISLASDKKYIYNTIVIIKSIFQQNVNEEFFEILLILSKYEFNDINPLPEEIQILRKMNKIKIKFINQNITNKLRTIITFKEYMNNPILMINNLCIFPDGWLKMLMNDHLKYPNDAIVSSIQYFFGKNDEITELSEGFQGENFGTFNHVTELIFNFALINIDLGGILYPSNYFKNHFFYDIEYLEKGADISDEFWQAAFIILEDKIIRQSSKIFDYTKFWINTTNFEEYNKHKKSSFEKDKLSFIKIFPYFNDSIKRRKNKIIVSITSYPKRFIFLPDLMTYIKNQRYNISRIFFFLYKNDIKYLNMNINDSKIVSTEKNLRPHLKYFYAMKLFRDHAIITLDDDIGYSEDTFESLYNEYIENPNVICGRRSHLMTYENNGELKSYFKWKFEQKIQRNPDFNLILTNVCGSIYPPDILNIKDEFLPIIKETITCDDLTLKYFENLKGIPIKWVYNNNMLGIKRTLPKNNASSLFKINLINNNICINKLNIMINTTKITNLCAHYKNITTGKIIYLFDIHNKTKINNVLYFDIYAYSYCPIDLNITFKIFFENLSSFCFFRKSKFNSFNKNTININNIIASCNISNLSKNLDDYYFPSIKSSIHANIKIFNYIKYSSIIYKNFYCIFESDICFLKVILYETIQNENLMVKINNKSYICKIILKNKLLINFPVIKDYKCNANKYFNNNHINYIGGIPKKVNLRKNIEETNIIPISFVIYRTYIKNTKEQNNLMIVGKLSKDIKRKIYYFSVNLFFPDIYINCNLKPNSKYVMSYISCANVQNISEELLIENQIIHLNNNELELLLLNEETIIKKRFNLIKLSYNEHIQKNYNIKDFQIQIYFVLLLFIIIFILKINIKLFK